MAQRNSPERKAMLEARRAKQLARDTMTERERRPLPCRERSIIAARETTPTSFLQPDGEIIVVNDIASRGRLLIISPAAAALDAFQGGGTW